MMGDDEEKKDLDTILAEEEAERQRELQSQPTTDSGYSEELEQQISALAEDISLDDALSKQVDKKSDEQKARERKYMIWGACAFAVILLVMTVYSCQPTKGTMAYGICSTFLQLASPYPHTLNYTNVEQSRTVTRIYYTSTDPFGEFKLQIIECKFGPDPKMGSRLTQIAFDPQKIDSATRLPANMVDQKTLNSFNASLPTVIASDPYRVLPPEWKNQLLEE